MSGGKKIQIRYFFNFVSLLSSFNWLSMYDGIKKLLISLEIGCNLLETMVAYIYVVVQVTGGFTLLMSENVSTTDGRGSNGIKKSSMLILNRF